jgi:DNA-binding PadR family transcriptional regulator
MMTSVTDNGRRRDRWHGEAPRRGGRTARCRWWSTHDRRWSVNARIERFVEPALLLLLREAPSHGYDLADGLASIAPDDRVDLGNLYRLLRDLENEGLVTSRWRDDLPGKAKRTYELTGAGRDVLDAWVEALTRSRERIDDFLQRHAAG